MVVLLVLLVLLVLVLAVLLSAGCLPVRAPLLPRPTAWRPAA
jgi:hypothetical protein